MARRKKYTVGLWMDLISAGKPSKLQIWSTQSGVIEDPKLKWHTVVMAHNEDEALQLGQDVYASPSKKEQAA